jgi:hypothetical protein
MHGDTIAATLDWFDGPEVAASASSCLVTIERRSASGWIEDYAGTIIRAVHRIDDQNARTAGLIALRRPANTGTDQIIDKAPVLGRIVASATDPDLLTVGTSVLQDVARTERSAVMPHTSDVGRVIRRTADPAGTLWDALGPKLPGGNRGREFHIGILAGFVGVGRDKLVVEKMGGDERETVNRVLAWVLDGTESPAVGVDAMDRIVLPCRPEREHVDCHMLTKAMAGGSSN